MNTKRRKTQMDLAFTAEDRGEAPKTVSGGTEVLMAECDTERRRNTSPRVTNMSWTSTWRSSSTR